MDMAQEMIAKRVNPSTASGYRSRLKIMGKYFSQFGSHLVDADGLPTLPVDTRLTIKFFGAYVIPRSGDHDLFGKTRGKMLENGGHPAASTMGSFKSALAWSYLEAKIKISDELNAEIDLFITGYKKEVARLKQQGEMTAFEGKQALTFSGYVMLSDQFLHLFPESSQRGNHRGPNGAAVTWTMGIFAWAFLILQWNFIARSVSMGAIMLAHLSWKEDHLTITTPRTKTDQSAENAFPKSIFANPLQPIICPILALAVSIFSRLYLPSGIQPQLFDGPDQEESYGKNLVECSRDTLRQPCGQSWR